MNADMRAAVYLGPERVEIRRVPVPAPRTGEVLVRVRAALTCGTDVKTYRRGHPKFPPPFVFGHEFAGDVVEVGQGVAQFRAGMRVTANVFAECGTCFFCLRQQGNLCENLVYNLGAFAEYLLLPPSIVRRATFEIPPHLTYAEAALLEPLVSVVHGWHKAAIQPGERVALLGAGGPISLLHLQLALQSGAAQVIAVGHSPARLAVAAQLGATHVLNAKETDTVAAVRDLTEGYGADVVIECAGTPAAWETAVQAVRKGGRVVWFGGLPAGAQVAIDATRVHYGEIALLNLHGGTAAEAREAFELLATGRVQAAPLLTGRLGLDQVVLALQQMMSGAAVKNILDPAL